MSDGGWTRVVQVADVVGQVADGWSRIADSNGQDTDYKAPQTFCTSGSSAALSREGIPMSWSQEASWKGEGEVKDCGRGLGTLTLILL